MWESDGRGVWGGMDTNICVAESLRCSAITTLLLGCTPIQNKKVLKLHVYVNKQINTGTENKEGDGL